MSVETVKLKSLILETKDGDWGKEVPKEGFVPYRVIRGGDFPDVENGNYSKVPTCYLSKATVHRRTLQVGDLLIETAGGTSDRSTGRVLFISEELLKSLGLPVTCASFARFIRLDSTKVNPKYVFWYLRLMYQKGEMWQHQVQHTGIARFQWTKFCESVDIKIPTIDVQNHIVDLLDSIINKITINRQINKTLEGMAQALFKSWFVDFEPVKAKIATLKVGGDPNLAAMRAISGKTKAELEMLQTQEPEAYVHLYATASLFPEAFKESELGMIPSGWEVSTIGEEVEVVGGSTPSTANSEFWEDGKIHWTSPKDLSGLDDKVLLSTASKITEIGLKRISSGLLPIDTVLMSSRAPVGYLALAKVPVAINQGYIAMKCSKRLSPEYIIQWADSIMGEIQSRASGSTFAEISKASFRPIPVLVPISGIMASYSKYTKSIYNMITERVKESADLSNLRDILLIKLLSEKPSIINSNSI